MKRERIRPVLAIAYMIVMIFVAFALLMLGSQR